MYNAARAMLLLNYNRSYLSVDYSYVGRNSRENDDYDKIFIFKDYESFEASNLIGTCTQN